MVKCKLSKRLVRKNYAYEGRSLIKGLMSHLYRRLKYTILDGILNVKIIRPFMSEKEIEIVEEILKKLNPTRCLEWGSGYNSTLYFPKFLDENAKWLSIEHNKEWFDMVSELNSNENVQIFHIKPNDYNWTDKYSYGSYLDFKEYIEFPGNLGKFDFILVDGKARNECIIKAYELLEKEGIVILHDANRDYNEESLNLYNNQILIQDARKYANEPIERGGGIWIGSKKNNIEGVLDINKHKKLWSIYTIYSKLRKVLSLRG